MIRKLIRKLANAIALIATLLILAALFSIAEADERELSADEIQLIIEMERNRRGNGPTKPVESND